MYFGESMEAGNYPSAQPSSAKTIKNLRTLRAKDREALEKKGNEWTDAGK
jgi:hypothetical protein